MTTTKVFPRAAASASTSFMAVGLLVLLGACDQEPPPTKALRAAETAIENAEKLLVEEPAPTALGRARVNLAAARDAVRRQNMELADGLARTSEANAYLAVARAEAARARADGGIQQRVNLLNQASYVPPDFE